MNDSLTDNESSFIIEFVAKFAMELTEWNVKEEDQREFLQNVFDRMALDNSQIMSTITLFEKYLGEQKVVKMNRSTKKIRHSIETKQNACTECTASFSSSNPKIECKGCANLYCQKCCSTHITVPQMDMFTPVKVCDLCKVKLRKKFGGSCVLEVKVIGASNISASEGGKSEGISHF